MTADQADRELLQRIATGDLRADAPEVQARRAGDPAFAAALAELLRTLETLEAAGAEERTWLAEAAAAPAGTGLRPGLVAETIGRLAAQAPGGGAPAGRRPSRPGWILAVAAAAAALILWFLVLDRGLPKQDDRPLGGKPSVSTRASLKGEVLTLEWSTDLAGAGFAVTVWAADDPARRALLEATLAENRWHIEPSEWKPVLPRGQALRWRVVATKGSVSAEHEDKLVLPH